MTRGAKIGLVSIGINYKNQSGELHGCINDSNHVMEFLQTRFGRNIVFTRQLIDTLPKNNPLYPSRRNIVRILKASVRKAQREQWTHFWLHYSGHGGQQRDRDGDEKDGLDETLVPVDYNKNGMITDDWLLKHIVTPLGRTHFFALIDACHSESMLDLRFKIDPRSRRRVVNRKAPKTGNAMLLSGCKDNSYSYDTYDSTYGASGAMTAAFLNAVNRSPNAPIIRILGLMRKELRRKGYPQIPQLSSTKLLTSRQPIYGFDL